MWWESSNPTEDSKHTLCPRHISLESAKSVYLTYSWALYTRMHAQISTDYTYCYSIIHFVALALIIEGSSERNKSLASHLRMHFYRP